MTMRTILPIAIVSAMIGGAIGIFLFITFVGADATPSATLAAPTLDINAEPTINPEVAATQIAELNTQITDLQATITAQDAQVADLEATIAEQEMTGETETTTEETDSDTSDEATTTTEESTSETETTDSSDEQASQRSLFRIAQEASQVTFTLDEVARGREQTVVGSTDQVAGDVIIDFANPGDSQVGTIRINARSLQTDQFMRNNMLRSRILLSERDDFEFIDFVPTELVGLPGEIAVGETYTFDIVGDLTIIGQTQSVTFNAEVTIDSEAQISGTASTTVAYANWGIAIPRVPVVSSVDEAVVLEISFTANQVDE